MSLESRLLPLVKAHEGKVAIAVKPLAGGDGYVLDGDEVMPTASLIKFPVMVEAYHLFAEGRVRPTDLVILQKADMVQGAGILTPHFSPGATFSLRDAIRLMIVYSDNTATNLALDHLGIPSTNVRMAALGLPNTRIHAKVFKGSTTSIDPPRTKKYGLGSTTANEMIRLLELLHEGKLVGKKACAEMVEHMKKCEDPDKFPKLLPRGTALAMKTGSVSNARTAAGIFYLKAGPVAVCVLTNENKDQRYEPDSAGNVFCAKVAKEVYDHFLAPKGR
jgi:beta-lactamase class A